MLAHVYTPRMTIRLIDLDARVRNAVRHYWNTLDSQAERQGRFSSKVDTGYRAAVTGGKQMDGFCELVETVLQDNHPSTLRVFRDSSLEIPGYFRPTKKWDMLVFYEKTLLAAIEFKSQRGPSFGNNLNNRAEEAVGTGNDAVVAYREFAFGQHAPRPWLGWLMLLEDCPGSRSSVGIKEPHFPTFPEFRGSSYALRYELLLRRLRTESLFSETALLLAPTTGAASGAYAEPADDLAIRRFLASLVGHVSGIVAS